MSGDGQPRSRAGRYVHAVRHKARANPTTHLAYRLVVGVVGCAVLAVGIVTIPYPGPGWLIVFAGLGILATEFAWARTALTHARERYHAVMGWYKRQGLPLQVLGALATAAVVLATLWALGTFALVGGWFGLRQPWLGGLV